MTDRERLEKAINDMETTSVCLDVFDRAVAAAKQKVWEKIGEKIEAEMEKENESTDDQIWEIRDWCRQEAEKVKGGDDELELHDW